MPKTAIHIHGNSPMPEKYVRRSRYCRERTSMQTEPETPMVKCPA
jgi:hypothetical protein